MDGPMTHREQSRLERPGIADDDIGIVVFVHLEKCIEGLLVPDIAFEL